MSKKKNVFETPWFQLISENITGSEEPYYYLNTFDYVTTLATTTDGDFLLVEQFRTPMKETTFEFPSGHLDEGETPIQAAKRELLEETGFDTEEIVSLGPPANPDTGRFTNKLWCFYAKNCTKKHDLPEDHPEGIKLHIKSPQEISEMIQNGQFNHCLNLTPLFYAQFYKGLLLPSLDNKI